MQSTPEQTGRIVDELTAGAAAWAATPLTGRRELLLRTRAAVAAAAEDWVAAACRIKRLPTGSSLAGEEWLSGPYAVLTALTALADTLAALQAGRSPVDDYPIVPAPGGRLAVQVLPHNVYDRLLLSGHRVQVWLPPGVDEPTVRAAAGLGQRRPGESGGVGVVLGAGNISSIPPLDVLYELMADNRVSVLKLNPITDELLPVFERAFAPLIEAGVLRIVTGGAEAGQQLVHHPGISHVHMTGSGATHDAIVFGTGAEGAERKAADRPLVDKPVTSELGGVSPIIVVPGRWSRRDIRQQAEHVATMRLHNGGYNCIAGQVLIVSADWPQRAEFLAAVREALRAAPDRDPYYPGSTARLDAAAADHRSAERIGRRLLLTGLPRSDDSAYRTEYFAPVLAVTELPGAGLDYFRAATSFANDELAGTLGANVIVHPATLRAAGDSFWNELAGLRYGTVAVNAWTAFGFLTATAPWGAFPGNTRSEVGSGIGVVHNALLLDSPERTVVTGPFRAFPRSLAARELSVMPRPPWYVSNRTAATTGRLMTRFAARPGWSKLPAIFASALRG